MQVVRLGQGPVIGSSTDASIGTNIQGPSVVAAPPWVSEPLGRYYMYFADHKGTYIRLAYANVIEGPWTVHVPGTLHLEQSCFLTTAPEASQEELARLRVAYEEVLGDTYVVDGLLADATTPHIASPDVHLDLVNQQVVMYFHGLEALSYQVSRVALSSDGISFTARPEILGGSYLRTFSLRDMTYAMTMPGRLCRSADGLSGFEQGPELFDINMRHTALWCHDDVLDVLWTRVGDAPESILWTRIDVSDDWEAWTTGPETVVLAPEREWEGALEAAAPSKRGPVHGLVNQLRDPAIFHDGDRRYLFYAGGGESAIGVAEIHLTS